VTHCRWKLSENKVLRTITGPEWEEVRREWRKLHNEELQNSYYSPNNKEDETCGACGTHGNDEKCIQNSGRKSDRKMPFGRPRRRWEENIKINLRVKEWKKVDLIHMT
jgi:hypothetical protein